jgi:dephospho-CoA kinase
VILLALTGGIGSGKSSVSSRLADRGVVVIDADGVARELQARDGEVFLAMVERWGEGIVGPDGELNRQAVADIVFKDKAELKALNKIAGPAIRRELGRRSLGAAELGKPVLHDIPLFVESRDFREVTWSGVIVVDTPPEVAVARLVAYRGFSEDDAWARVRNQATREARLALADIVVDNSGTPEQLDVEMERVWAWLADRPEVPPSSVDPLLRAE